MPSVQPGGLGSRERTGSARVRRRSRLERADGAHLAARAGGARTSSMARWFVGGQPGAAQPEAHARPGSFDGQAELLGWSLANRTRSLIVVAQAMMSLPSRRHLAASMGARPTQLPQSIYLPRLF